MKKVIFLFSLLAIAYIGAMENNSFSLKKREEVPDDGKSWADITDEEENKIKEITQISEKRERLDRSDFRTSQEYVKYIASEVSKKENDQDWDDFGPSLSIKKEKLKKCQDEFVYGVYIQGFPANISKFIHFSHAFDKKKLGIRCIKFHKKMCCVVFDRLFNYSVIQQDIKNALPAYFQSKIVISRFQDIDKKELDALCTDIKHKPFKKSLGSQ